MIIFTILATLLSISGLLLLLLLWWLLRKTDPISPLPWISLFLIYGMISPLWTRIMSAQLVAAVKASSATGLGEMFTYFQSVASVLGKIPPFLMTLMAIIYAAALLKDKLAPNRASATLAGMNPLQPLFGVLLMLSAMLPDFAILYFTHLLTR